MMKGEGNFQKHKSNFNRNNKEIGCARKETELRSVSTDVEYQSLRDEIMIFTQNICNYNIAMYTLCITLLGFSIELENAVLSLLIYLVILVFQSSINKAQEGCNRLSAYIQVFLLEDYKKRWSWEHHRMQINDYIWGKKGYKNVRGKYDIIAKSGSIVFALVATIVCIIYFLSDRNYINFFSLCISIICTIIIILVDKSVGRKNDKMCVEYQEDMRVAFRQRGNAR